MKQGFFDPGFWEGQVCVFFGGFEPRGTSVELGGSGSHTVRVARTRVHYVVCVPLSGRTPRAVRRSDAGHWRGPPIGAIMAVW